MQVNDRHTVVKQQIAALMASPTWAYLTPADHHHITQVATVCGRHSHGGAVLTIHLEAVFGRPPGADRDPQV